MHFFLPSFFVFVATLLVIFYRAEASRRPAILLAASLLWVVSFRAIWLLPLLFCVTITFWLVRWGAAHVADRPKMRSACFVATVALNVTTLLVFRGYGPQWFAPFPFPQLLSYGPPPFISPQLQFVAVLGVNFYVFQLISYAVDVWRGQAKPFDRFRDLLLFTSFFPKLANGPLERTSPFRTQLTNTAAFDPANLSAGLTLFAWGFFQKIFVADSLIFPVKSIFHDSQPGALNLILASFLATLQEYSDFNGHCDMGRGVARTLGIRLSVNFRPFYLSRDPQDFWRRWNLTLGNWIRDYVTLPLMLRAGRVVPLSVILFLSFLVMGIWHGIGPAWLAFGVLNGAAMAIFLWCSRRNATLGRVVGRALVLLVFFWNGFLQASDQAGRFFENSRGLFGAFGWGSTALATEVLTYAIPYAAPLVLVDCLWRRDRDDFYETISGWKRFLFAMACFVAALMLNRSTMDPFSYL